MHTAFLQAASPKALPSPSACGFIPCP